MVKLQTNAGHQEVYIFAAWTFVALQRRPECVLVPTRICTCEHLLLSLHGTSVAVGIRSSQSYGINGARFHA